MTTTKDKILRADQRLYDGVRLTGSRRDSSGATISGLKVGNEVDVLQVYGEGENYNHATIKKATTAIGSAKATLLFAPGTWTISANTTIPSNLPCRIPAGCVFDVAAGVTLTFSGPVLQDHAIWTSGSGTVTTSGNVIINGGITLNGTAITATADELNKLDGVTASTAELNILDGVTATASELNTLDGVTATASELNELDASAAAISNYSSGVRHYIWTGSAEQELRIDTILATGVPESIGPTGSGADNTWSALDAVPSTAKAITLSVHDELQADTVAVTTSGHTKAYATGVSPTNRDDFFTTRIEFYNHNAATAPAQEMYCRDAIVPVDSSNRFTFSFTNTANVGARTIYIYLTGFIV